MGGLDADEICRRILGEAPRHLNEGGFCQVLANWAERDPEDWQNQLLPWFEGNGCDVWVMRSESRDAATYASTWISHTERDEPDEGARRFNVWTDYYRELGIQAVSAGIITLRRSAAASPWYRAEDAPDKMIGPCGRTFCGDLPCGISWKALAAKETCSGFLSWCPPKRVCTSCANRPPAAGWKRK